MADPLFNTGDKIEVFMDEEGLRGAWFSGTVIKTASKKGKKVVIEFDTLVSEKDEATPLREPVDFVKIRPCPPRESYRLFKVSEEVDAYHSDGWWEGIVIDVIEGSRYSVYFRCSGEQIEFDQSDLRLHREWIHGDWVPPFPELQELSTSGLNCENEIQGKNEIPGEDKIHEGVFSIGDLVEVSSDEDGYQGAWFAANVVQVLGEGRYLIEHLELRTDDDTELLKEEVDSLHIRPTPPKTEVVDRFSLYEEVDAFYKDVWWVGVISKVLENSRYTVYFKMTDEEMKFRLDQLRPHQDWMNGKWVTTSKVLKFSDEESEHCQLSALPHES